VSEFFESKYQEAVKELEISKNQISLNFKQIQSKEEEIEKQSRLGEEMTEKVHIIGNYS